VVKIHRRALFSFLYLSNCLAIRYAAQHTWCLSQQQQQLLSALCLGLPGTRRNIHPLTSLLIINYYCLLFATCAQTIATWFAVVPGFCHLILVCFSTVYLELFFALTSHIRLTILTSARWIATPFSFLTGQVSVLQNWMLWYSEHALYFNVISCLIQKWCHLVKNNKSLFVYYKQLKSNFSKPFLLSGSVQML